MDPDQVQFAVDAQALNRAAVAAFVWLVYDTFLTLEDEIQYIWKSAWSLPKAMYLWSRYQGLILSSLYAFLSLSGLNDAGCQAYSVLGSMGPVLVSIPADALLLMRVRAVCEDRRILCRILLIYYYVEKVLEVGIVAVAAYIEKDDPAPPYAGTTGCFHITVGQNPADAVPALLFALLYNAVLFGLTISRMRPYWRTGGYGLTPMLTSIVRDGAMYFGMICCLLLLEIVLPLPLSSRPALATILVPWLIAGYPIASCRLLLHLRGVVKTPHPDHSTLRTQDLELHVPTIRVATELGTVGSAMLYPNDGEGDEGDGDGEEVRSPTPLLVSWA